MESKNKLKRGLSTRHIRFMALGSAIGTGLFYGSADAIKMAGHRANRIAGGVGNAQQLRISTKNLVAYFLSAVSRHNGMISSVIGTYS